MTDTLGQRDAEPGPDAPPQAGRAGSLRQGDAVSALAGGYLAAGPLAAASRGVQEETSPLAPQDVFVEAVPSSSGWYVVTAQDCDIAKDEDKEPTLDVAPAEVRPAHEAAGLVGKYRSRFFLLPEHPDMQQEGHRHVVDLAYQVPVLRQAFDKPDLKVATPLTEPNRRRFAQWLGHRKGRIPFPDEVVETVLVPFSHVRSAAQAKFSKASAPGNAPQDARLVGAVLDWHARTTADRVEVFGEYDHVSLSVAGLLGDDLQPHLALIEAALAKLRAATVKRMAATAPDAGYELAINVGFLDDISASEFRLYTLLVD